MWTASTEAVVCLRPWARRKSGTSINSASRDRNSGGRRPEAPPIGFGANSSGGDCLRTAAGLRPGEGDGHTSAFSGRAGRCSAVRAGKTFGTPDAAPACRLIHGAREPIRVDEGFGEQQRMSILSLPVGTEGSRHRRLRMRFEVREHTGCGENQETGVVADEV